MAASSDIEKKNINQERNEMEVKGKEEAEVVLDLSGRKLKKLEKAPINQQFATALVLDNNQIQNINNLDSYGELERLSIANNEIIRMYWFARMYSIRILNLPNNNIVQIEGLRELHHLLHLNLSGNHIKTIEGLSNSYKLEHLNLSGNNISQFSDISMLKNLKELFLHRNQIESLQRCTKLLPHSLLILTLSDNFIADLNELNNLSHLTKLEQFTVLNNPCLEPLEILDSNGDASGHLYQFDYRPFVINWCLNLRVLDGYKITPKESLKGEWLYSQGKGRSFQVGDHAGVVQYLSSICPVGGGWGGADLPDDDSKLAKVLELAKQHQHDVRHADVNVTDKSENLKMTRMQRSTPPVFIRKNSCRSAPPRHNTGQQRPSRSVGDVHRRAKSYSSYGVSGISKQDTKESMNRSYNVELASTLYGSDLRTPDTPSLMTQSMDPSLLSQLAETECTPRSNMSLSMGPDQMSRSLDDRGVPCYGRGMSQTARSSFIPNDIMNQSMCREQLQESLKSSQELDYEVNLRDYDGSSNRNGKLYSNQNSLDGTPTSRPVNQRTFSLNTTSSRPSSADTRPSRSAQSGLSTSSPQRTRSSSLKSPIQFNTNKTYNSEEMSPKIRHSPKLTLRSLQPSNSQLTNEQIHYIPKNVKPTRRSSGSNSNSEQIHKCNNAEGKLLNSSMATPRSEEAAIIIQKYWRGYNARQNDKNVRSIREHIRHSRTEDHIRYLSDKLRRTEVALEKEKRLRRLQLDAIRTLWREIQKMQSRKDGSHTPSTPMTPLTPITPLDKNEKAPNRTKVYSEESVNELTKFCKSLESQVQKLESSLSYVNQVTSYLCHLPGAQQLLANLPNGQSLFAALQPTTAERNSIKSSSDQTDDTIENVTNSIVAMTTLLSSGGKNIASVPIEITEENNREPEITRTQDGNYFRTNGPTRPSTLPVKRLSRES